VVGIGVAVTVAVSDELVEVVAVLVSELVEVVAVLVSELVEVVAVLVSELVEVVAVLVSELVEVGVGVTEGALIVVKLLEEVKLEPAFDPLTVNW
jgi:hypothetical protein